MPTSDGDVDEEIIDLRATVESSPRRWRTYERGALKRLREANKLDAKARERFSREIEGVRKVRSPFVVRILDAGTEPDLYLVTEVAALGSLHDNREAFRNDPWRTLRMIRGVALGLAAAHAKGIVHRDVKPKNVLLQTLEHPLVADLGIAHFEDLETITSLDSNVGAYFFAPREFDEDGGKNPTHAYDV